MEYDFRKNIVLGRITEMEDARLRTLNGMSTNSSVGDCVFYRIVSDPMYGSYEEFIDYMLEQPRIRGVYFTGIGLKFREQRELFSRLRGSEDLANLLVERAERGKEVVIATKPDNCTLRYQRQNGSVVCASIHIPRKARSHFSYTPHGYVPPMMVGRAVKSSS